ncbi:TRAP transporter small permease [Rhizobiaceae bacterium]|nr:TRAP transporter small permease [Rhizobiaceae bacterium]
MIGRVLRALDAATQALNIAGTILIVGIMLLIGADVLSRNLFNAPLAGVPEMVALSIVAIVFLQVPQALRAGRFTRSTAVLGAISSARPRVGRAFEYTFDVLAIFLLSALLYASWPLFTQSWLRNTFVGAVGDFTAPVWPVKLVIVVGTAMLMAQFAARIVIRARTGKAPGDA